jgi:hypothetical protein
MIQMVLDGRDGVPVVMLGLTRENIDRLLTGQPVFIRGAALGVPTVNIAITAGEDEKAILDALRDAGMPGIGPKTVVKTCCPEHAKQNGMAHVPFHR